MQELYRITMMVAAMAVVCALLEFCMTEGPLKKSVILAIGMVFVLIIAGPIINLCKGEVNFELPVQQTMPFEQNITHQQLLYDLYTEQMES